MDKYLHEVSTRIAKSGSTVPAIRAAFKKGYTFSNLPFAEQLAIWEFVWKNNDNWRVKAQSFFYCEKHACKKENAAHAWKTLRKWQDDVNDWPFCDSLSKIYTKHLEIFPDEVYAQLTKWNSDKDPWKRRQSIVSLLYYTRTKKVVLPYGKILRLIENLLADKEYYVQKGVGWSLRELYNAYPEKTYVWMQKNITKVSGIAFSAATEKLNAKQKAPLKKLRK